MKPPRSAVLSTAFTVLVATLSITLGLVVAQAGIARAADTCSGLSCLTFTSVNGGRNLDVQNGNTGDGVFIVTNSPPGYHQKWDARFQGSDSSFALVNGDTGKCIEAGLPLKQQSCSGSSAQRWYFQPVNGATDTFMIRSAGDNKCLDVVRAAQYDDAWTQTYGCNGTKAQQWKIPSSADEAALKAAVDYASKRCQKDSSTCSWTKGSQAPAEPLPKKCVSPVWYNGTEAPVPWTFSLNTSTGWSSQLGVTFTSGLGTGAASPVQTSVSLTVSGQVTYDVREDLGNSLTITVPSHQYGWVALSELATKVTGQWTFDASGFPWQARDTVTVPLKSDEQGRSSIYLAQTSPDFTTCNG
ncbi:MULTISPECIES: RICIN domain-containing protein [unclassified Streptomyces]|uniref:RICIN domain-containing protein n=1 Tax=unclassified Streptomyces TaxID=2593676 RepID=UPI00087EF65A|nr:MULTISPECIES: RICIN domain-containing protein [unclassified Streptomyces]PBC87007.1 ricin-type beta-trefoil lectin protein [Streptomyces sp. 2321.6]SDQ64743.1 Ricin-type beta-trefoil lectin domain-like [Streptomyces sp. KS_16]SEE16359.1 Ricin-type beta-trefoil lectin domain-like [Streptomyces sp. 2133.1]SNC74184.1 Ricin-type beta-trefoil lectin domain-like [Streptomyces sp. 2114.4]